MTKSVVFSNAAPRPTTIRRLPTRQVRVPAPPSLSDFIRDTRICFASHLQIVEAVEARGSDNKRLMLKRSELPQLFANEEIHLAFDKETKEEYIVLREAFEEYKLQIYHHESLSALRIIEANHPEQTLGKELFKKAEELVLKVHRSGSNLRHLSFMLKEAADAGADFITAAAIMVHNLEDTQIRTNFLAVRKAKNPDLKTAIDEILKIKRIFCRLDEIDYLPHTEGKMPRHYIQNFMDAMIKIAEGNGGALLLLLLHRFSSFMRKQEASPQTVRSVIELYAPLAERFGQIELGEKLRNEAFRIENPEKYHQIEQELVQTAKMTREEAGLFLDEVEENLIKSLKAHGLVQVKTRFKKPWESYHKTQCRAEEYPDIFFLEDILGGRGVTEKALSLEAAMEIAKLAVGDNFIDFNYDNNQTETKVYKIGGETYKAHHISVILRDGNKMEFQFMDKNTHEVFERGPRAHFKHKLEQILGQEFDEEMLEQCRKKMNGDFNHDVKMVYEELKPWTYVFFHDTRFKEKILRVIRRMSGSLPLDVVPLISGKDISAYAGVRIKKIWETRLNPTREDRILEDGDFLELKTFSVKNYLTRPERARLSALVKHALTKFLLYFNNDDSEIEKAAQKGESEIYTAARQQGLRFNRRALEYLAFTKRMNLAELFAAVGVKIVPLKEILQALAPTFSSSGLAPK